ncbi:hypothetical protein ACVWZZ_005525 [Bradyrhizobium sp. LM6.10]
MMYLDKPPQLVETRVFSSMPAEFRRPGVSSKLGRMPTAGAIRWDCFIEGPSFDKSGDLYVVDILFGRIFRICATASGL